MTQAAAACQHLGVATIPCVIGACNPELVRISGVVRRADIWLLSHKDARGNRRMQLFRDLLIAELRRCQNLLDGNS
jgi:DNA-binding transcriptional LysR family regulator